MELVRSRQNQTVRLARSLRERKARDRAGLFLAEGIRLAVEAAETRAEVEFVVVAPDLLRSTIAEDSVRRLVTAGAREVVVTPDVFCSIADREHPQGILVIARSRIQPLDTLAPSATSCLVAVMNPQDPGNVGSMLRTMDAVAASGLILIAPSSDPYDPRAVRASMGAVFSQSIYRCSIAECSEWITSTQIEAVAVSGDGDTDYRSARYQRPLVLVMGSEREGLSVELPCRSRVHIPMNGRADSLNLAVAASLMLYEVAHQSAATS